MPKTYTITTENATEIRMAMQKAKSVNLYRRMEAVALRGEGLSNKQVADITKYHHKRVSQLVSLYVNEGLSALAEEGRKGGNNRNISAEQEKELLDGFREEAEKGQIITPSKIKEAYDTLIGKETKDTFIYAVLKRNKWRGVMPRSQHPKKASEEDITSSKKLTIPVENSSPKRQTLWKTSVSCFKTKQALAESTNRNAVGVRPECARSRLASTYVNTDMRTVL